MAPEQARPDSTSPTSLWVSKPAALAGQPRVAVVMPAYNAPKTIADPTHRARVVQVVAAV